jgi:hypothetical protein
MTLRFPHRLLRPLAVLAAGSALALASCDQPKPAAPAAPEAPAGKVRPPRAPEPISWNPELKAFVLDGKPLATAALWTFESGPEGFQGSGAGLTPRTGGGLDVVGKVYDSILRSPADLAIKGADYNTVLVRISRGKETARWDGTLFWITESHGEKAGLETRPVRGADPAVGETTLMVYDLAKPQRGGDDWVKSTIKGLRLDLDDDAGGEFTLYQVAIVNVPGGVSPAPAGDAAKAPAAP